MFIIGFATVLEKSVGRNIVVVHVLSHVQLFLIPWTVSPPGSSVQARILEWVAISFSRGFS